MRRIFLCLLLCAVLATSVSATGITSADCNATVEENGSCVVVLTLTLQLDGPVSGLVFPLPANSKDITVNGKAASSTGTDGVRNVDLSDAVSVAGTHTLVLRYTLTDAVAPAKEDLLLTLPLLSGFAYPVEQLKFTVTLPGEITEEPVFQSVYYQEQTFSILTVDVSDNVISGAANTRLLDHENLTMTLKVPEEMFPFSAVRRWSMDELDLVMIGIALLALIYWLVTMRTPFPEKTRSTTPPTGLTAGELACRLTGGGVDFSLMVVSWAQMGYLLIQPDDNGRVLLHKRMDMGNERSDFEIRCFRSLFGKRLTVDATGYHYARLCRKACKTTLGLRSTYLRASGSPKLFRVLATLVGALAGVSLAADMVRDTGWQVVLGIFLFLLTGIASWWLQEATGCLHSRRRLPVVVGGGLGALWLMLAIGAEGWQTALIVILFQLLCGLGAAYGGIRTETGRQDSNQILGLRRFLRTVSSEELKQIMRQNPDYYHDLAPYALALGVDREFARQMGKLRLPQCPYLTTGMDGHMNAREFAHLLRATVDSMDALQRRLPLDRLLGK